MKKILLVEDDYEVSSLVRECLESDGYSVEVFQDGEAFISYLKDSEVPDCIVIDLILPGIDGVAIISNIKKKWPSVKVFVFSGNRYYESMLGKYLDGFVCKADGVEKLIGLIKEKVG